MQWRVIAPAQPVALIHDSALACSTAIVLETGLMRRCPLWTWSISIQSVFTFSGFHSWYLR
jgi:hypothetical protein